MNLYFKNMRQLDKWAEAHRFKSIANECPDYEDIGREYLCLVVRDLNEADCVISYAVRAWSDKGNFYVPYDEDNKGATLYYLPLPTTDSLLKGMDLAMAVSARRARVVGRYS